MPISYLLFHNYTWEKKQNKIDRLSNTDHDKQLQMIMNSLLRVRKKNSLENKNQ